MTSYLSESFNYLFNKYMQAKKEPFANNPIGLFIRNTIPNYFYATNLIDKEKYDVTGSAGKGNWAQVPWVGIFRRDITSSAMKGVYIVYLLSSDGESLYLTLNQGFSGIATENSKNETIEKIKKTAKEIAIKLNNNKFISDEKINLGAKLTNRAEMYQYGTILYKKYLKNRLPAEEQLRTDLREMLGIYEDYYEKIFNKPNNSTNTFGTESNRKEIILNNTKIVNTIFYGAPGTGKTYKMQKDYIDKFAEEDKFITTFHQSFSYEEFVEGLKPVVQEDKPEVINYKVVPGVFYNACERAAKLAGFINLTDCINAENRSQKMEDAIKEKKVVLLCIDEINRANVSAVFGDLISLIEPSKRIGAKNEMKVKLPYSKKDFAVPANLMIIGTMNTADRSIQLLDSALRRRFKFEELLPDYDTIGNPKAREILEAINARIRSLLDKDHQIGHSYFIDAEDDLDIFNVLKDCVIPLLEEYFYNDAQKIREILKEKGADNHYFYIKDDMAQDALKSMVIEYDSEKELFMLNPDLSDVNDAAGAEEFIKHIV